MLNDTLLFLVKRWGKLQRWHPCLTKERLKEYANALKDHGGSGYIWGFIDGTFRGFCRPAYKQRWWYSGHKKAHGLKWQAIVTPDGLIASISGPFHGKINDSTMVAESRLNEHLRSFWSTNQTREILYLYGDQAYSSQAYILSPWPETPTMSKQRKRFNRSLQKSRIAVECLFGMTQSMWTTNAFKHNLKMGNMAVASYWQVSVLLTNCYTCFRSGNQVAHKFALKPMSIKEYLVSQQLLDHELDSDNTRHLTAENER